MRKRSLIFSLIVAIFTTVTGLLVFIEWLLHKKIHNIPFLNLAFFAFIAAVFVLLVWTFADIRNNYFVSVKTNDNTHQQADLPPVQWAKQSKEINDYKSALDESSIVAITDQKGIIKHANDNFCKISKFSREELIGQDHRIVSSGFHPKEYIRGLWHTIANGKIWKGELKNKAKDGSTYWVDTTIVPFLDEKNKPYQYLAIRSDITERKKLEEHQLLFASIISSSDDAILSKDMDGIINSWNHGAEKVFGYSADEVIGKHISILIPSKLRQEENEIIQQIREGKTIDHYETERLRKDGKSIQVSLSISPIKDSLGNITGASKISRDITQQKKSEEDLKKILRELADYKYALDESSIVAITDQKGVIKYVNDNFCKISGYDREELLGQDHRIINSAYHPKEFIRELWVTIAHGKIWKGELRNKAKDGSIYWVDTTIVPFLDDQGKPYQYIAIRADITNRKKTEEKLVTSEKIYKLIASSIPGTAICLLDADYRYLLVEGDMIEKMGYSKEKLLGNRAADVIPPEIFTEIQKGFERAFQGESNARDANRNGYDFISRNVPLKDENNKIFAIMIVAIDITELKDAQRDIAELNQNLEEKIAQRTEQLKLINKELEDFSYSVSHDLRAPLRIINGFSQILVEDYSEKLDEEGQQTIQIIINSSRKMGQLIDDLLNFSKSGRAEVKSFEVDMNVLVEEVLQELMASGISIPPDFVVKELKKARGDSNLLKQVWMNLISNAVKYSSRKKDPAIEIGTTEKDGKPVYYIKDNGAGFDMRYADKLFGVFQRLHKEGDFAGTGVGLALVQRIILRHGGAIWAEAKLNEGAIFYFTIPG